MKKRSGILAFALSAGLLAGTAVAGDDTRTYSVTITNLTRGTLFTPVLVALHQEGFRFYQLGQPASPEMSALAEGGATGPLAALVGATPNAATATSPGPLLEGKSVKVTVTANKAASHFSIAAMMVPTNDGFIANTNIPLPKDFAPAVFLSNGHDAGSEPNDELCVNIPGPQCGGEGRSDNASGEGYVHIHAGIHGIGDLHAAEYDWRNPVARFIVQRVK